MSSSSISKEECIGDSLSKINNNFAGLDNDVTALNTRVTTVSTNLRTSINNLSGSFGALLAETGYQKLPSGLILQWGKTSAFSQKGSPFTVTFPIAFPVTCLNVTASVINTNSDLGVPGKQFAQIYTITNTSARLITQGISNDTTAYPHFWHAIGY